MAAANSRNRYIDIWIKRFSDVLHTCAFVGGFILGLLLNTSASNCIVAENYWIQITEALGTQESFASNVIFLWVMQSFANCILGNGKTCHSEFEQTVANFLQEWKFPFGLRC